MARLLHYLLGYQHAVWSLLYSDDGWIIGRGKDFQVDLVLYLFILVVLGAPLAWHKVQGGVQSEWVGYALDGALRDWHIGGEDSVGHTVDQRQDHREASPARRTERRPGETAVHCGPPGACETLPRSSVRMGLCRQEVCETSTARHDPVHTKVHHHRAQEVPDGGMPGSST